MLYGRNLEIHNCIKKLSDKENTRIVIIRGELGLGKRPLGNYALKYCIDRGFYKDGAYEIEVGNSFDGLLDKIT